MAEQQTDQQYRIEGGRRLQDGSVAKLLPDVLESQYVAPTDRYVVALIVGYEGPSTGADAEGVAHAAAAALALTNDPGSDDTMWWVFDRLTGEGRMLEQDEFSKLPVL